MSDQSDHACRFCGNFLGKTEVHEEFDFYVHPQSKDMLKRLHAKTQLLQIYDMDDYAIHRKLRSERGVVMPGYARLVNAWKWMRKMVEPEKQTHLL